MHISSADKKEKPWFLKALKTRRNPFFDKTVRKTGFIHVEKTINTKSGKTTYKGLTIEMMESYINEQKNAVALCAEFESIRQFAKDSKRREYPLLKQWFVEKFKEQYKMTDAKKIHAKHVMAKATSKVVKLAAAKPAVNQ